MLQLVQKYFITAALFFIANHAIAQITISGTVYDSSKIIPVKNVLVKSSSGNTATTDTAGRYTIVAKDIDSLIFIYNNKPTQGFSIKKIENISSFDISLKIRSTDKYKQLKEVRVFSHTFKQDSLENREQYAKIFNYSKPSISSTSSMYNGVAGMDLDGFINIFRFRRNRQLQSMQNRLQEQEQERYINYRFSKMTVTRITKLEGEALDNFMKKYRPDFEFTKTSNTVAFYQYILNASYQFKKDQLRVK